MSVVYFIDIKCKKPYTFASLAERAIGGTESTMLRVAQKLRPEFEVVIVQPCRTEDEIDDDGIRYLSLESARNVDTPHHVVLMRKIKALKQMTEYFPTAKHYLWIQDLPAPKYCRYRDYFIQNDVTLICNSNWQRGIAEMYLEPKCWFQRLFHPLNRLKPIKIETIYNVINPDIKYQPTAVDRNKLVFFSAPRKGLRQVLDHFKQIIKTKPEVKLLIANPGYEEMPEEWVDHPNLINVGSIANAEVVQHVREAFCVFYPQNVLPETFGVIYAEANTVGTPVLCYDIGAAREILSNDEQIMSVDDSKVTEKLMGWYEHGRPEVRGKKDYLLEHVVEQWRLLLASQK